MEFKFSSSHTKKSNKQQVKLTLIMLYLTQYIKSYISNIDTIISTCNQYKIINMIVSILFLILSLQSNTHFSQQHISTETHHIPGAQ